MLLGRHRECEELDHPPDAEIHLLDGGHFLLESAGGDQVAALMLDFLRRRLPSPGASRGRTAITTDE